MVGLVETAPASWQVSTGLRWIAELVGNDYALAARSWRLPRWLEQLASSPDLATADLTAFQRMVDALVAHGDTRAVALQRASE